MRSTLTHLQSEASVLIDLTTTAAQKLVVELRATVKLGFCSAPIHDVSFDSVFTTLELCALKPWLVRPAKESNCTVIVCGSHVKRVLTNDSDIGSLLKKLFLMSFTNFSSCVGAERVETVAGLACQRIGLHGTDCDSHVKRVLTWSDGTDFDTGLFLVSFFFALFTLYFQPSLPVEWYSEPP